MGFKGEATVTYPSGILAGSIYGQVCVLASSSPPAFFQVIHSQPTGLTPCHLTSPRGPGLQKTGHPCLLSVVCPRGLLCSLVNPSCKSGFFHSRTSREGQPCPPTPALATSMIPLPTAAVYFMANFSEKLEIFPSLSSQSQAFS